MSPVRRSDVPCGEAHREVLGGIATGPAVGDLSVREDAPQEPLLPAFDDVPHPWQMNQIDTDATNTGIARRPPLLGVPDRVAWRAHAAPIRLRMMAARSSAMVRIRSPSAPSIITRASDSVPE